MTDDELDPVVAEHFALLDDVVAPDNWGRIRSEVAAAPDAAAVARAHRSGRRLGIAAMAAGLVIGAAGIGAWLQSDSTGTDQSVAADGAPAPGDDDRADAVVVEADDCRSRPAIDALRSGLPAVDHEPSDSIDELIRLSPLIVRGEIVGGRAEDGGTALDVRVRDAVGDPTLQRLLTSVWTPSTDPPGAAVVGIPFIAFLDGEARPESSLPGLNTQSVHAEGLWVACAVDAPAASIIARPGGAAWNQVLADDMSLDQLWDLIRFPGGERTSALGPPAVVTDGVAVYDLALADGERFRLSLPEVFVSDMTIVERPPPAPLVLESDVVTISIAYESCSDSDRMTMNRLGSTVGLEADRIVVCRADELLTMEIVPARSATEVAADSLDLRPMTVGGRYSSALREARPELADCSNCAPWGPMRFSEQNVVVNKTGPTSVTAVDLETMAEVWTEDTGGIDTFLVGGQDDLVLDVSEGPLLALDPVTGVETWRLERDEDERATSLSGHRSDIWLLQTAFAIEGDERAPLLRRLDIETGEEVWVVEGRTGTDWQDTRPVLADGLVIVMDVGGEGALLAFELATGALVWTTPLDSPSVNLSQDMLALFDVSDDASPVLVARTIEGHVMRIDPATGAILWRTAVPSGRFGGTDFAADGTLAIDIATPASNLLLDPETGIELEPALGEVVGRFPPECVALVGAEPWLTLFSEDQDPPCVIAAEWQNIQFWNKGFDEMTVRWLGEERVVRSDDHFETGPIGSVLGEGPTEIEVSPYPSPVIWVLAAASSRFSTIEVVDGAFGPVEVGMTVDEATEALGWPVVVDPDRYPGPRCWGAVISGDPYSPTFVAIGAGDGSSVITEIVLNGPGGALADENPCASG